MEQNKRLLEEIEELWIALQMAEEYVPLEKEINEFEYAGYASAILLERRYIDSLFVKYGRPKGVTMTEQPYSLKVPAKVIVRLVDE